MTRVGRQVVAVVVLMAVIAGCGNDGDRTSADESRKPAPAGTADTGDDRGAAPADDATSDDIGTLADGVLTVCIEPDRRPFSAVDPDDPNDRYGLDLSAVASTIPFLEDTIGSRVTAEYVTLTSSMFDPDPGCELVAAGITYRKSTGPSKELTKIYDMTSPWLTTPALVIVTSTAAKSIADLAASGAVVASGPDSAGGDALKAQGVTVVNGLPGDSDLADERTIVDSLSSGTVQAVVLGWGFGVSLAQRYDFSVLDASSLSDETAEVAFGIPAGTPWATQFSAAVSAMVADGGPMRILEDPVDGFSDLPGWELIRPS